MTIPPAISSMPGGPRRPDWAALTVNQARNSRLFCQAAFAAGLLLPFTVNVVGALPLSEFVLLGIVGLWVGRLCTGHCLPGDLLRQRIFWLMMACQLVALASYMMSDLVRGSSAHDAIRGWSRMMFLAVDIVAFAYLFGEGAKPFLWGQIGAAAGGVLAVWVQGALFDDTWKFGYGGPISLVTLVLAPRIGPWMGGIAITALGLLHLAMDFRSMGGICFMVAALLGLQRLPRESRHYLLVPIVVAGCVAALAYHRAQGADPGRGTRSNVERTAMITAAWECFYESPLVGQGSWFGKSRMLENFLVLRKEAARAAGVHGYATNVDEDKLAVHSQLLVSISEGGVLGGAFFFFLGGCLGWALYYVVLQRDPDQLTAIYLFVLLMSSWNLFLSPFSGAHRVIIATSCGLVLLLRRERTRTPRWPVPNAGDRGRMTIRAAQPAVS